MSRHPRTGSRFPGPPSVEDPDSSPGHAEVPAGSVPPTGPQVHHRLSGLGRRTRGPGVGEFAVRSTARLFLLLVLAGVVCGPLALILSGRHRDTAAAATVGYSTAPTVDLAGPTAAGSTAVRMVRVWLSASQADLSNLAGLVQVDISQADLPVKRPAPPTWVQVGQVARPGGDTRLWVVTVLAGGGGVAGTESAYRVLVREDGPGFTALTLPARVGLPAAAGALPDEDSGSALDTSGTVAVTVAGFTDALLTGSTDSVSRWTSPGSSFAGTGHVCETTRLDGLLGPQANTVPDPADGDQESVLATVGCTLRTTGSVVALQYPLVLKARAGRWEVLAYAQTPPGTPAAAVAGATSAEPSGPPAADPETAGGATPSPAAGSAPRPSPGASPASPGGQPSAAPTPHR